MFAGLHFRLPARLLDGAPLLPYTWPVQAGARALAHVDCELELASDPPLPRRSGQAIEWSWQRPGPRGQTRTSDLQIGLERPGPRHFRVRARVPRDVGSLTNLLSAVAAPL
ncbi:MAG TPA: hypothetical protein VG963_05285, partial [Polyangiaceae bacterium]|nr:hypothetical protein [Polyangiaceae bacterium]